MRVVVMMDGWTLAKTRQRGDSPHTRCKGTQGHPHQAGVLPAHSSKRILDDWALLYIAGTLERSAPLINKKKEIRSRFLYSVNLTEYVAMEPRVCVCVCMYVCVYVCVCVGQHRTFFACKS